MLESQNKRKFNQKQCILSKLGHEKLLNAIGGNSNNSQLASDAGISRDTVAKIIERKNPVTYSNLDKLFSAVNIDLEDSDFEQYQNPHPNHIPSKKSGILNLAETKRERLENALRELDYQSQQRLFEDRITSEQLAASFLIHGQKDYGQRWLVNLLKYRVPYHDTAWQKPIYIKPHRRNIETVWQNLAQELGTSPSPQSLVEQLYQHWQTKTVILAIYDVDLIAGSCLQQFMDEFWYPLVDKVNEKVRNDSSGEDFRSLVLFLVDNKNAKDKVVKSLDSDILLFEELKAFDRKMVKHWMTCRLGLLLPMWNGDDVMEKVICDMVERDNQPISVFTDICSCFDLDWEQDIHGKLAL
ncbi:MAG TPA: hypothetical protein DEG17_11935 [Cyanobacteria bacterium UBA11149]|nr:hypothetical protein [Cyanobacteria bacterium UBA11367]HBE56299.1 hypothetical protein [Cyanobacteria bacterium UBA11366]HBK65543.1 hypothetical protein [Cyanobacteria bacterium UBA11166]HBR74994.1 hypothetical protein [Cyanobacteria bacterium UBA11159]HBS70824.1 hypothetical protein [Cyanobacteria bacterium UBA11153]HBW89556.1 hypothetical protein [Cyanobacteria bacterium UBA11149]HCA94007.1 hypothetical protein [Cyanobacteria bacterium UBA9226]